MRRIWAGAAGAVAMLVWLAVPATATSGPAEFAEAEVFTEINATDGDAGFHLAVDGQDWRRVTVHGPNGKRIFDVRGAGSLGEHGLTGLTFESAEPGFDELSLEEFKDRFPEGTYTFRGWAVDGTRLVATGVFTHDFPAAPDVIHPEEGGVLSLLDPTVRWVSVVPPPGSEIVHYEVIVIGLESETEMSAILGPEATSMQIPAELLAPGGQYKVEVLAKEASGNQTITEVAFETSQD